MGEKSDGEGSWQLKLLHPQAHMRLETRLLPGERLDILAMIGGERIAFELKYLVHRLTVSWAGELFELPAQAAHDIRRYDFVKDVGRLERHLDHGVADQGFAILLTNEPNHWQASSRGDVADAAYRLTEGRSLTGVLGWGERAGHGTTAGREAAIALRGTYELAWRPYSVTGGEEGHREFRYLVVQVVQSSG